MPHYLVFVEIFEELSGFTIFVTYFLKDLPPPFCYLFLKGFACPLLIFIALFCLPTCSQFHNRINLLSL